MKRPENSYMKMHEAYTRVFQRGSHFRPVEADSGAIGSETHEFMVLAESGEASILL